MGFVHQSHGPTHIFQFIIQAQGQNCHGGLVLGINPTVKTAVWVSINQHNGTAPANFHSSTLVIIDIHDVRSCSCLLNSGYTDSGGRWVV